MHVHGAALNRDVGPQWPPHLAEKRIRRLDRVCDGARNGMSEVANVSEEIFDCAMTFVAVCLVGLRDT